jgi:micrococcal nuclease
VHYIHPALFSEATRFMMLDAITAVGGIMFVYLAIREAGRRAWREIPRARHAAFNAKQGPARQNLRPRRLIPFVALIAGIIAIGAVAYFALAQGHTIEGPVRVIDGDTVVVAGVHVRLNGIDAEEVAHPGYPVADPHGEAARAVMQEIVGIGSPVRCNLNGERSYDRLVGVCFNALGQDIGAEIVRSGAALDCAHYSGGRYRLLEPRGARTRLKQANYC